MSKPSDKDRVKAWDQRVVSATKNVFEPWEQEYDCDMLEEFYYGKQHEEQSAEWSQRKYVINEFFPAINISKPSLLYTTPKYKVTARPTRLNDPLSDVETRARLQEDTLQSEVERPRLGFSTETSLAILDARFRFGVVQIGYTADYVDNPNAGKPILNDDQSEMTDSGGAPVMEAKVKVKGESLYIQWIPAKQFRVSEGCGNRLATADWCGYFRWVTIQDVKQNPRYKNTTNIQATGRVKGSDRDQAYKQSDEHAHEGMIKVWFIWDQRAKTRFIWQQGGEKFFLEESYKFLPFPQPLKFHERLGHFLPLPQCYNWVHPQNELNDTREMQRIHRKRAKRRYRRSPAVTAEEFAKLEDGEDMVCIETPSDTDITPIPDAPLDQAVMANVPMSHQDFTRISGISGESQQVAQSETATQANLIAVMGQTRQSADRLLVAQWLSDIGRIILMTLKDKMALPLWIKKAVDPASPLAAQEAMEVKKLWKQIEVEELGDIDNDISVEIESMSPVSQEQGRNNWMQFLGIVTNPTIGMILSNSPTLLRKTAGYFDIRSERDLKEVAQAMQASAMMFAQAQADKAGVSAQPSPGATPSNAGIAQQLTAQLPTEMMH